MKKMYTLLLATLTAMTLIGCGSSVTPVAKAPEFKPDKPQDIQIYTAPNADGKITSKSIEAAFKAAGFAIDGNNNMNTPFQQRFKGINFETYRLLFVHNPKHVATLAKDFPSIGLISPLSTSVYSNDTDKTMNISSLSLNGMSKITGIPKTNKTLIEIHAMMNKAMQAALPGGHFQNINYKIKEPNGPLVTTFEATIEEDEDMDMEEAKESFQEELEGEIEPVGFIVAGFVNLNDEFVQNGLEDYDFYDAYSICKLEVIYPVSKLHPEVGAFAPCTLYMYKKKDEETTHLGFPSVQNWISSTDIEDEESLKPLLDAQNLLDEKIREVAE